jgi:membrane protease YdiL (CAAX protease family)
VSRSPRGFATGSDDANSPTPGKFKFRLFFQLSVNSICYHEHTKGILTVDGQKIPPTASIGECCLILAICLGLPVVTSLYIMAHHDEIPYRFTDATFVGQMIFELLALCTAGFILYKRGWRYQHFGIRISFGQSGAGLLLLIIWYATYVFLYLAVQNLPGMENGPGMIDLRAEYSMGVAVFASAVNALFEESVTVGYLLNAMRHHGVLFAIGLSTLVRLLYHTYQGPIAVISIIPMGILFGIVYIRWRSLWPLIFAHFVTDVLAFMQMKHLS